MSEPAGGGKTIFRSLAEGVDFIYHSYNQALPHLAPAAADAEVRDPGLTRALLDAGGSPDQGQKIVLVTGSKGKGSVAAMIAAILTEHGYKTGLFTSPHLVQFTERIRVDGEAIDETVFLSYLDHLRRPAAKITSKLPPRRYLGPVGITLAVAMQHFAREGTDFDIIEAGRGGRYDDVNALANQWAVTTPILPEHTGRIGPTLADIAWHKAGIVKDAACQLFTASQEDDVLAVLVQETNRMGAPLLLYGRDFQAGETRLTRHGLETSIATSRRHYGQVRLPLLGRYQAANAALATAVAEAMATAIQPDLLRRALAGLRWPGRSEIVAANPTVLVDGSISRVSARELRQTISIFGAAPVISIVAVPEDKDYRGVMAELGAVSQTLIVTKTRGNQFTYPADCLTTARQFCARAAAAETLEDALALAMTLLPPGRGLVCIAGVQGLVGEVERYYGRDLTSLLPVRP